MATTTVPSADTRDQRRTTARTAGALLVGGGLLTALGGALHPSGTGASVEAHLLSMFASPAWPLAHAVLLVGTLLAAGGFTVAWRARAFGVPVQRWLGLAVVGWGFGAAELVPHLLAAGEAHALEHHEATPLLDVHLVMQVVASPAVGLSGAALALAVARGAGSAVAWALAGVAVVGGTLAGLAAPLVVLTGDPAFTVLFPLQAGLSIWLVGTGLRLLRRA